MIAILTDTHFGARGDSPALLDAQEKFYTEIFFPTLEARGVTTVLHLGDTFDRRKIINFHTLQRVKGFYFSKLGQYEYHAIVGNHDTYFTNVNDVNSVNLLSEKSDYFHLYVDDLAEFKVQGLKIAMCPWLNRTNKERILKKLSKSKSDFIMGHFAIDGFEMMKGRLCEGGLDKSIFKGFEAVYSGHFHHPSSYSNIKYLGAPYEMNWSDHDGDRGFHLLDPKTRLLEFVPNTFKIFHKLTYSDKDLTIADLAELDLEPLKGCFVKLIIKEKTNPYLFDQFLARLSDAGTVDLKVLEDSLDLESVDIQSELEEAKDTREILHSYIDELSDLDVKKIKSLKNVIDGLYQEALDLK